MTYPEPRYFGEKGEVSATYRPANSEPDIRFGPVAAAHYLATGESTNGQFGLYLWQMGPEPAGPGPHFHRSISESFYILSGVVRIYNGDRWTDARPGDFVHVPEGGIHAFRNESGEPASMLLHFAPGAPREGYFEGLPRLAAMSEEERNRFFLEHDNFWLQPSA
jgi:mannose-6-phosphate isomerase-like protein (cupin superfamily)